MDINDVYQSGAEYLKAADLQGRDAVVTIETVQPEDLREEKKLVCYFQKREKALVLNKTNALVIADAYGPETDAWIGRQITLYPTTTFFDGRNVPCIRVRIPAAAGVADDDVPF